MKRLIFILFWQVPFLFVHGQQISANFVGANRPVKDTSFWQEYHQGFIVGKNEGDNDVRSIAVDNSSNIWIASASGIFVKDSNKNIWSPVIEKNLRGPAYAVIADKASGVWMGTWDGVYRFQDNKLQKIEGVEAPISALCKSKEGIYALGPKGVWLYSHHHFQKKNYPIARSIQNVISDGNGGLWVATKVGLYHCSENNTSLYQDTTQLISAYVEGIAESNTGQLWAVGLGGVSIRKNNQMVKTLTPAEGLPTVYVNCIQKARDGTMWVGTRQGIVRYKQDGSHSLRFSRRWLINDNVRDISFDTEGNAWIATAGGVSVIRRRKMTLSDKEYFFYDVLMRRHIRAPWIAGQCHLRIAGDTTTWAPEDDDNDGEYTSNYLAMESFRYAVTKDEDAHNKALKAFNFLKLLQDVTGTDGFFARTIVSADWTTVHDGNRTYTERQLADALVDDPRFKPVEKRWHKSADGKWIWKDDTSSDEMCGHMMGYFFFYELVADKTEKEMVRSHVRKIMDYLIRNNYNFKDVDGSSTRWGVWSPDQLNHDPEWASEKSINSFELLAFLKFTYGITHDKKYQNEYLRLINKEGYLSNIAMLNHTNPAWYIFFDETMNCYLYPILLRYEDDPAIRKVYEKSMDEWYVINKKTECPLFDFMYAYVRHKKINPANDIRFLTDTPLDLIDWHIDHRFREDVKLVREPTMEDIQVDKLPPASIRSMVRWDKNPWLAESGDPHVEREPVFWLLPYWMARYLKILNNTP
ncbi:MAG: two-component regulator propeller domain-containing protein [Bacteroidota bacterium]|nr:two-component regulator propeller domain-containing protein [Bacteroidota bacterium]